MVEAFFNFSNTPFQKSVPAEALYASPALKTLLGRLEYGAYNHYFMTVTGDSGSGKTTAIRQFVGQLDTNRVVTLYISDSNLTPRNFYYETLGQLGVQPRFYRGDAKRQLTKEVSLLHEQGKLPVVILDEVHLCGMEMLTEIRFLLNFNMDSQSPMSLILVGQTEFRDTMRKKMYEAISQRIDLRCHIPPLDRAQTADYIAAHMRCATSSNADIFTDAAILAIYEYSSGLPRKINRVAAMCLMHAAQSSKRFVDDHMVSLIVETELSW